MNLFSMFLLGLATGVTLVGGVEALRGKAVPPWLGALAAAATVASIVLWLAA